MRRHVTSVQARDSTQQRSFLHSSSCPFLGSCRTASKRRVKAKLRNYFFASQVSLISLLVLCFSPLRSSSYHTGKKLVYTCRVWTKEPKGGSLRFGVDDASRFIGPYLEETSYPTGTSRFCLRYYRLFDHYPSMVTLAL